MAASTIPTNGSHNVKSEPKSADRPETGTRLSAIDIGSNSIRQIIAEVSPTGAIKILDEMKAAPRLGEHVASKGEMSETAIKTAVEALSRMALLAEQLGCKRTEVVATSAVRDSTNRSEFLRAVRNATGLRVRVLDGETEAKLSFRSALAHFDLGVGRAVVLDIGGGSLELTLSADGLIDDLLSLPLGALHLTELFFGNDRVTPKQIRSLRKYVRKRLRSAISSDEWQRAQLIGSGGTCTNLAGMILARQGIVVARSVHGTTVERAELEHLIDQLGELSIEERKSVAGLNPGRADIILAGLIVLAEVMARLDARQLVVSAYGIREGLLLTTARIQPTWGDPGEGRERSVRDLAERSRYERPHAETVEKLALQLFDSIGRRLGCTREDRQILADAALLHDIGYHINYDKHHKHSYHLILHADLLGMTPTEQVMIANVSRYHRGATPRKSHDEYAALDKPLRRRIRRLSALLRVADGLDRGHSGVVERIRTRWSQDVLRITAYPTSRGQSLKLELWGAAKKASLLEKIAGVRVEIVGG